jgi:[FeFe] hydrogenase H-cluster maturation GTPase HydF
VVLGKADRIIDPQERKAAVEAALGVTPLLWSHDGDRKVLISSLVALRPESGQSRTIVGNLVEEGDTVVLIMPQDASAPKGRLILPQVQTIRELLDRRCIAVCSLPEDMERTLAGLAAPPKLIITDSQVFGCVAQRVPEGVMLTSFSVLMAAYKGDVEAFMEGARAIDILTENSRVLIAEACTHAPATEDIGRVKLPRLLRSKLGEGLVIDIVLGSDFPDDLLAYDLVIHCGACMFNRRMVMSRVRQARAQGVPITNYGIAIATLTGIIDRVAM